MNKKPVAITGVVLLVMLGALASGVAYGRATLDKALTRINIDESERLEYVIEYDKADAKIAKNSDQLTFGDSFNYDNNLRLLDENDRLVNALMDSKKADCARQAGRFKVSLNVFSRLANKEKHDGIVEALQLMPIHSDDDCQHLEGLRSYSLFLNDMDRAKNDAAKVTASNHQDAAAAARLAKFSDGTYKVSNMDAIKALYSDAHEELIETRIRSYGAFYEDYVAFRTGNVALSDRTRQAHIAANQKTAEVWERARAASIAKNKAENAEVLKADIRLYNLLTKLNDSPRDTQFSNGVWVENVLISALRSYRYDNMNKYPQAANAGELVRILKEKGYLEGVEPKLDGVTYSSTSDTSYTLSFKNEITGKEYTYTHQIY